MIKLFVCFLKPEGICLRKIGSIYVKLGISILGMLVKLIVVEEELYSKIKGLKAKIWGGGKAHRLLVIYVIEKARTVLRISGHDKED